MALLNKTKCTQRPLLLVFTFLFLFSFATKTALAGVTTPLYTIDYKPQVLFADSIEIGGYRGLENYVAEYVGGYLHITYTISHANGYWAGYPPFLYVRSEDPSVLSDTVSLYQGLAQAINNSPSNPTDFYFVDIQFSTLGYREIVTRGQDRAPFSDDMILIPNMDNDTFIALANQYPLQNPPLVYSMSFAPMRLVSIVPSKIVSFDISAPARTATVHSYISPNDIGSRINFNISTSTEGQVYAAEAVHAATAEDFYYTWNYPELTDPRTTKINNYTFYTDIEKDSKIIRRVSRTVPLSSPVEGYPGYYNFSNDASEGVGNSYNHLVQTLGTNLSGILTQIDVQTSNPSVEYYGSRPLLVLYECDDSTYGNYATSGSGCTNLFTGVAENASQFVASAQSFYTNPIVLDPSKYYLFNSLGNNQFNALPYYYGSSLDTVDGSCHQFRSTSGLFPPCANVSDLYFYLRGVSKSVAPPTCATDCFSSVLFLPGLEASRLYEQKTILGFPMEDQLWEPNANSDVEALYLDADGGSINPDIYTKNIIKETNTPASTGLSGQNIYKSFSDMMDKLVADQKIAEWRPFAYDWRKNIEEIVNAPQKYGGGQEISLVGTLQSLVNSAKNGKVTIVAHSNGGLLAKALLKKLQDDKDTGINNLIDSVDALILVAVPQIGTASAVPAILHGYNQRILLGFLLDEIHARELGRNMLGAFGLLPSREYLNRVSISPATFTDMAIPSGATTRMVQTFGGAVDSYAEYKDFLFGNEGRTEPEINETNLPISLSPSLFSKVESLHNGIDAWAPPASLRVIEVAGWGLDTIASFEYYPRLDCSNLPSGCTFALDERPRFTSNGDRTAVAPSAHYTSFLGNAERYWVDLPEHNKELGRLRHNREHKDILEINQLNNFIQSVIEKKDIIFDTVLKNTEPIDTSNRLRISIHSPVTLDAYDAEGNHTGKICPPNSDFCYAEENISNSSYMEFGGGKYINLPEEQMSAVKLRGISAGTFTYKSEKVMPDGTSSVSSFVDIPVTAQTEAEITTNPATQNPELKLDATGDGAVDFTLAPSAFDPLTYLKIMKIMINSFDLSPAKKKSYNNYADGMIKSIQKGRIDKMKRGAAEFRTVLERKLAKLDPNKTEPGKLSRADMQFLLDMLDKLLDNMS